MKLRKWLTIRLHPRQNVAWQQSLECEATEYQKNLVLPQPSVSFSKGSTSSAPSVHHDNGVEDGTSRLPFCMYLDCFEEMLRLQGIPGDVSDLADAMNISPAAIGGAAGNACPVPLDKIAIAMNWK